MFNISSGTSLPDEAIRHDARFVLDTGMLAPVLS